VMIRIVQTPKGNLVDLRGKRIPPPPKTSGA